jgi:hypothetical protein
MRRSPSITHGTLAELSAAERISQSYICRVLRLTLLGPEIVERILDGRPTAGLAQFLEPFPVEWERQRERLPAAADLPSHLHVPVPASGNRLQCTRRLAIGDRAEFSQILRSPNDLMPLQIISARP